MSLIRWDPFRAIRHRAESFDEFFRRFEPALARGEPNGESMERATEVAGSENQVTVKMTIPVS